MQGLLGRLQWESRQLTGPYFYGYSTHLLSNTALPTARAAPRAEQPSGSRTRAGVQGTCGSVDGTRRGPARTGSVPVAGWCRATGEAGPFAIFH